MGTEAMLETVKQTIADWRMLKAGELVLAALSGGADSVALLRALLALGYPVHAFHLNHCLRGAESDRDEAFCRALCERLGVPLTVERIDVGAQAAQTGEGVEAAARRIRYARLAAAARPSLLLCICKISHYAANAPKLPVLRAYLTRILMITQVENLPESGYNNICTKIIRRWRNRYGS